MPILSEKALRWAAMGCVPAIAIGVVGRPVYLHHTAQLSTWKGGGMGMFAAADGVNHRFAKIFIVSPKQGRQPLVRLTPVQKRLMDRALWYPARSSFEQVAKSIFATSWAAGDQQANAYHVDASGKQTGKSSAVYYMLYPFGIRLAGEKPDWDLEIEYWTMSYNPDTRRVTARHSATHRFETPS